MKLLISGTPCCGKTSFGDWLRDTHRFTHINLELEDFYLQHVILPALKQGFPCWISSCATHIVVTWGYPPNAVCYEIVRRFTDSGFSAWWFDADLVLARQKYLERDGIETTEQFFDPQAERLRNERHALEKLYAGHRVTTLTPEGYVDSELIFQIINEQ